MKIPQRKVSSRVFAWWAFLCALEGGAVVASILREPSEAESVLFLGLSSQRLILFIGVLFVVLFFLVAAAAHFYRFVSWNQSINQVIQNPKSLRSILTVLFLIEITLISILFLVPDYLFPTISVYLPRLKPVIFWLLLIVGQTLLFFAFFNKLDIGDEETIQWKSATIFFMAGMLVWGFISLTRVGITPDDVYWNMAGVPVLAWQVWFAVLIMFLGAGILTLLKRFNVSPVHRQWTMFVCVWAAAALLWVMTPLAPSFNAPGPYFPQKNFYPFVDAALFDLGAQSAIFGKGFQFGLFFDRALLMGLLAYLHLLFGQNYQTVVGAQAILYAVFPALIFLLGKKLHSEVAGILAATLAMLKVANAIAGGTWLSTSHPKLMLTEFPTAIVIVAFILMVVIWLKEYQTKSHYIAGAGAVIGIGILLRTHVFFLLPALIVLGMAVWKLRWKIALRDLAVLLVAFFITISPWMWRNQHVAKTPFFFLNRFNTVIQERYESFKFHFEQPKMASLTGAGLPSSPTLGSLHNVLEKLIVDDYQFIPNHFFHNVITSFLVLPPSPVFDDLRHAVDLYPYWDRVTGVWMGQMSFSMGFALVVNLAIFSIGLGAAWRRVGYISLAPILVYLSYNLANAFARTSGGRYLVPTDWIVVFFYAIGIFEIINSILVRLGFHNILFLEKLSDLRITGSGHNRMSVGKIGMLILPFFLIVASLPALELTSPGAQSSETSDDLVRKLDGVSFFQASGVTEKELNTFLKQPAARLLKGRGFYPRFYSYKQGETILTGRKTPYSPKDFPRLVFTLLLPTLDIPVLLPMDDPKLIFPDAAEVIVGGCYTGPGTPYFTYIDAAFIVILDERGIIYVRAPEAPLRCPLREPVCDDNRNCW